MKVERVVLNALADKCGFAPIFAPSAIWVGIVFGEADPPGLIGMSCPQQHVDGVGPPSGPFAVRRREGAPTLWSVLCNISSVCESECAD
jgi:hypothetical protein